MKHWFKIKVEINYEITESEVLILSPKKVYKKPIRDEPNKGKIKQINKVLLFIISL